MTLKDALEGKEYFVRQINTDDEELNEGCLGRKRVFRPAN